MKRLERVFSSTLAIAAAGAQVDTGVSFDSQVGRGRTRAHEPRCRAAPSRRFATRWVSCVALSSRRRCRKRCETT